MTLAEIAVHLKNEHGLRRRRAWFDTQPDLEPEKLVFIDETGASTKMARRGGRAPRGRRCRAPVPHGHWKTTTFVAALRLHAMTAPMILDGGMYGAAFLAYVEPLSPWNFLGNFQRKFLGNDLPTRKLAPRRPGRPKKGP